MTYTVEQIRAAVEDQTDESLEPFGRNVKYSFGTYMVYPVTDWSDIYGEGEILVDGKVVKFQEVESFGGEGQGDHMHVVFRVGDQLFKKSGYHVSHDGSYWDGPLEEVKPVKKTVVVYE